MTAQVEALHEKYTLWDSYGPVLPPLYFTLAGENIGTKYKRVESNMVLLRGIQLRFV
jgi:hypothetical protein